jgi:hypothetical protein
MKFFKLLAVMASVFVVAQAAVIEKDQEGKMLDKRINWSNKVHQYASTDMYISLPHNANVTQELS